MEAALTINLSASGGSFFCNHGILPIQRTPRASFNYIAASQETKTGPWMDSGRALIEPCPSCPAVRILLGSGRYIPADFAGQNSFCPAVRTDELHADHCSPATMAIGLLNAAQNAKREVAEASKKRETPALREGQGWGPGHRWPFHRGSVTKVPSRRLSDSQPSGHLAFSIRARRKSCRGGKKPKPQLGLLTG
jgi:hypothetical protein